MTCHLLLLDHCSTTVLGFFLCWLWLLEYHYQLAPWTFLYNVNLSIEILAVNGLDDKRPDCLIGKWNSFNGRASRRSQVASRQATGFIPVPSALTINQCLYEALARPAII